MAGGKAPAGKAPAGEEDTVRRAPAGVLAPIQTPELPLNLRDGRLPWLEGDDDDPYEDPGSGRLIAFVLLGLLLLGVAAAGVWFVWQRNAAGEMVAEGGVIRAPAGPYKVRPTRPGGDVAAGTGDTSFLVAAGKHSAPRLERGADAAPFVAASGAASQAAPEGVGVQLGAYSTAAEAEAVWPKLEQRYPVLSGLRHRVVEVRADLGSVFALQAVTGSAAEAKALCGALKPAGLNCQVKG